MMHKRAEIPQDISSIREFLQALGISDAEQGLSTTQVKKNISTYGKNEVQKRCRCRCKCSLMPFFYLFLMAIVAGVTSADYFLYEYDFWYI